MTEAVMYNEKTLEAMDEAKRISRDPEVWGYTDFEELKASLEKTDLTCKSGPFRVRFVTYYY